MNSESEYLDQRLRQLFGNQACSEGPLASSGAGRRFLELDMCKRRVYIPKRNDLLDEELAKFLKTYDKRSKLKIMFLREAEGVYLFGQRRVILQLDKNNKVCVK